MPRSLAVALITLCATSALAAPAALRENDTVLLDNVAPEHVVLLDANGDGLGDIVAIDAAGDAFVFPQLAEGGFGDAPPVALGTGVVDAVACDLDRDGAGDLIAARVDGAAGELLISLAAGGALSSEPLRTSLPGRPRDVDCDAATDENPAIVVGREDGEVHVLRWQGSDNAPLHGVGPVSVTALGGVAVGRIEGHEGLQVVVTDEDAAGDDVHAYAVTGLAGVVLTALESWPTEGGTPTRVAIADLDGGDGGEVLVLVRGEENDAGAPTDTLQLLSAAGTATSVETLAGASALSVGDAWVYSSSLGFADVVVVGEGAAGLGLHERTSSSLADGVPALCTSGCGTWSAAPSTSPAALAVGSLYERCAADIVVAVPSEGVVIVPTNGPEGPYTLSGEVTHDGAPVVGATLVFAPGGETATTDGTGAYTVEIARTGRHDVVVEADDLQTLDASVEVTCAPNVADFALEALEGLEDAGVSDEDAGGSEEEEDAGNAPPQDAGEERPAADAGDEDPPADAGEDVGPADGGINPVNPGGCSCDGSPGERGGLGFALFGLVAMVWRRRRSR